MSRFDYTSSPAADEVRHLRALLAWLAGKPAQVRQADKARALDRLNAGVSRRQLAAAIRAGIAETRAMMDADQQEAEHGRSAKVRGGGYSARAAEQADAQRGSEGDEAWHLPSEAQAANAPIPVGHNLTTAREERAIAARYAADVAAGVARAADGTTPPLPNAAPAGEEAPEASEAPTFPEDVTAHLGTFALAAKLKGTKAPSRDSEAEDAHASASAAQAVTREQARALLANIETAKQEARAHWLAKLHAAGVQAKALGYTQAQAAIKAAYIAVRDRQPLGNLIPDARAAFKKEAAHAALR